MNDKLTNRRYAYTAIVFARSTRTGQVMSKEFVVYERSIADARLAARAHVAALGGFELLDAKVG